MVGLWVASAASEWARSTTAFADHGDDPEGRLHFGSDWTGQDRTRHDIVLSGVISPSSPPRVFSLCLFACRVASYASADSSSKPADSHGAVVIDSNVVVLFSSPSHLRWRSSTTSHRQSGTLDIIMIMICC